MELPNRPTKDPYQEIPVKDFSYINTQKNLPKKTGAKWGWIVAGLVVFLLLGAGAYLYGRTTKPHTNKNDKSSHKTTSTKSTTTTPNIALTNYSSSVFNLTINYPTSWSVSAVGNTSLSFSSPEMSIIADTGSSVEGKMVLNIYNQGQIPAAFGSTSVAVLNSQDVNFSNPTSSQAAQSYISFVQYPATDIKGGLDGIYVTGNNGYLKDQNIPATDVDQVSPLVIVNFLKCQNTTCTETTPLTVSSNIWNESSIQTPVLDMVKSLVFS